MTAKLAPQDRPRRLGPGDVIEVMGRRYVVARYDSARHSLFTTDGHEISASLADDGYVTLQPRAGK